MSGYVKKNLTSRPLGVGTRTGTYIKKGDPLPGIEDGKNIEQGKWLQAIHQRIAHLEAQYDQETDTSNNYIVKRERRFAINQLQEVIKDIYR